MRHEASSPQRQWPFRSHMNKHSDLRFKTHICQQLVIEIKTTASEGKRQKNYLPDMNVTPGNELKNILSEKEIRI